MVPGETSYTQYDRDITTAAVNWIQQHSHDNELPWVLYVSYICPHFPLTAPQQFYDLYRDVELPSPYDRDPETLLEHPVIDKMREFWNYIDYFDTDSEKEGLRNYYGLCSFLDDNVRQVMQALENSNAAENTQIVYTSDHGDMIGNHAIWAKCYMYEDSVGIPMVISGPGIEPGVNETPVSLVDIAATVELAVTGKRVKPGNGWQSRALHTFVGNPEPERVVLSEYHDGGSPLWLFHVANRSLEVYLFFGRASCFVV